MLFLPDIRAACACSQSDRLCLKNYPWNIKQMPGIFFANLELKKPSFMGEHSLTSDRRRRMAVNPLLGVGVEPFEFTSNDVGGKIIPCLVKRRSLTFY